MGLFTILNINAQTQNNVWSLPPNYYNNATTQSLPIGGISSFDYQGEQALYAHNAMQDANGNLLFFVLDGKIYDKDGYFIDEMYHSSYGTILGGQEIAIVLTRVIASGITSFHRLREISLVPFMLYLI